MKRLGAADEGQRRRFRTPGGARGVGVGVGVVGAVAAAAILSAVSAFADGIWQAENLLADPPVRKHGLVTIVCAKARGKPQAEPRNEQHAAKAKKDAGKKPAVKPKKKPGTKADKKQRPAQGGVEEGGGKDDLAQQLAERLTARVIEVLPNGNLVLEARSQSRAGGKVKTVVLIGEVRARDVSEDRTVALARLADVRLSIIVRDAPAAPQRQTKTRHKGDR